MGTFVVIEGIDGCGKSTQVKLLTERLARKGFPVTVSKWQDSSYIKKLYIGDLIRKIQTGDVVIPPQARTFLLGCDISYRLENIIRPQLGGDSLVVGDRYIYKIIAQGIARGLGKQWLLDLFSFAPEPDLSILLDVPAEVALRRITSYREVSFYEAGLDVLGGSDREGSFIKFQRLVRQELLELIRERRGVVIDGELPIEEQSRLILEQVERAVRAGAP